MKIARIETFIRPPGAGENLLFCRVETESGLHGCNRWMRHCREESLRKGYVPQAAH
jgi:galactonate dehydratase